MKLVIDIQDTLYEVIKEDKYQIYRGTIYEMIKNGTPLPKGHGNLKDVSQLAITPIDITDLPEKGCLMVYLAEDVDEAPAIIEADTGGRNE